MYIVWDEVWEKGEEMKTKTVVKVRFQVVGFHCWPQAPKVREYLKRDHRHVFHFQVEAQVSHGDREVEFHTLQEVAWKQLEEIYYLDTGEAAWQFGPHSCETMANRLLQQLEGEFPGVSAVEVWEDGECGARVEKSSGETTYTMTELKKLWEEGETIVDLIRKEELGHG